MNTSAYRKNLCVAKDKKAPLKKAVLLFVAKG